MEPRTQPVVQNAPMAAYSQTLEGLPAELRMALLLNMPDLATLSRLVHASPVFHAQYLLERKSILFFVLLKETTDDVLVDVYAAFKSHPSRIGPPKKPHTNMLCFLESTYLAWRSRSITTRPTLDTYSLEELSGMASFQQSMVNPLATHFVSWALANFRSHPAQLSAQPFGSEEALTRTERTRVMRALYRFEEFCNLLREPNYEIFVGIDPNEFFFSSLDLEPWEAEEVCTVFAFVKEKYEAVLDNVKWDLDEANPRFDSELEPELEGLAFGIDKEYDDSSFHRSDLAAEFLNGTIGHGGLNLALKMIEAETHNERVDLMTRSLRLGGHFLEEGTGFASQMRRRFIHPKLDGDGAEERRQAMPFAGDEAGAPPLAWTLLWGGRYSSLFGESVPVELRRWGYVIWDARRLDVDRTKDYLKDLWESSPALMLVCRHWGWMSDLLE
ncbi:hypothetical protein DHEL01_v211067 [Diaporthe helianthi]|uniref:Uncharacterized protein n=1 Tax=Diaporthe helianthi TaxID=158607 RepID=A0A2P5HJW5_DIAHE|nr:hypothetical protein DHEL01_v211067 [Diaporthe helianthi]